MTRVPILTAAMLRAWGLDDPRVLAMLRAENQPGRHRCAKAVGERARAAGWPTERIGFQAANDAQIRALRRLERMDWSHQGRRNAGLAGKTTAGQRGGFRIPGDWLTDDGLVSIFDE